MRAIFTGLLCLIFALLYKKKDLIKFLDDNKTTSHKPLIFLIIASLSVFLEIYAIFSALKSNVKSMILVSLIAYLLPVIVISLASTLFMVIKLIKK